MDNDELRDPLDEAPEPDAAPGQLPLEIALPDELLAVDIPPMDDAPLEAELALAEAEAALPETESTAIAEADSSQAEPALDTEAMTADEGEAALEAADLNSELAAPDAELEAPVSYDLSQALFDAGIDVDAALGALSFELASSGYDDGRAASRLPAFTPPAYKPKLRVPPPIRLQRGQIGSLLPALILIGVGAWLTLTNASGSPVDPALAGVVLTGGLMLSFAAHWLFSGRWARGLLLVALLAVLGAGGAALVLGAGVVDAQTAWPLLLAALGIAIILSGLLARPADRAMLGPGMVFITAGIVGFLALNGAIPASVLSAAAAYWFVSAAIVGLLLLLPLIFRKSP